MILLLIAVIYFKSNIYNSSTVDASDKIQYVTNITVNSVSWSSAEYTLTFIDLNSKTRPYIWLR